MNKEDGEYCKVFLQQLLILVITVGPQKFQFFIPNSQRLFFRNLEIEIDPKTS